MTLDTYNRIPKLSNVFFRRWFNQYQNEWIERLKTNKCMNDFWYMLSHYASIVEFYTIGLFIND